MKSPNANLTILFPNRGNPRAVTRRGDWVQFSAVVAAVADGVDEGGLTLLDLLDGAFERELEIVGVFDWAFGVPTHRSSEPGEIRIGAEEIHADVRAVRIGAAGSSQNELMIPVVIVGAIVKHDDEHRDLVLGRDPERSGVEHEIAV